MLNNRSVPTNTVLPHITYQDVEGAITWLSRVFGFKEHYRYGEPNGEASGAQMFLGDAWIMLNQPKTWMASPKQVDRITQHLTIFVDGVDDHYNRVVAAGATIVEELNETFYGERQYAVEDLEGHRWIFSQHIRDVRPEAWGAVIAEDYHANV